jgi:hypothetical protein
MPPKPARSFGIVNACIVHDMAMEVDTSGTKWDRLLGLVEHGFDVTSTHPTLGSNVLHWVCCNGTHNVEERLALVRLALRMGADPNGVDRCGRTPVQIAAGVLLEEPLRELVAAGGKVNAPDLPPGANTAMPPLFALAVWAPHRNKGGSRGMGARRCLQILLEDPDLDLSVMHAGRGAAEWAREHGEPDLAKAIAAAVRARDFLFAYAP